MLSRNALAAAILAAAPLSFAAIAAAQDADPAAGIDFTIRPTQDELGAGAADTSAGSSEPGPSMIDTPVGPPLAGPTLNDPIGPPLAGPLVDPLPIRQRRIVRPPANEDPFAAAGIRVGAFTIRPSLETGVSATDNAALSANKKAAVGLLVAPEINVTSTGKRYDFEADARGEEVRYKDQEFDRRTINARAKLRYDLTSRTSIYTDASYDHFLEGFSDPDTPTAAAERPAVDAAAASFGVEQRFGRISARLTGFADRAVHSDVPLVGGGTASLAELDNTEFGMRFRTGYATDATLRPFAEVAVGRRLFDQGHDDNGYARSSVWGELRGGIVIDRGSKLSGEASVGYRHEDMQDSRLEDLNVLLANASILWSPRRLTEVKLDLTTDIEPTTVPGTSATAEYASTLSIARNFTPRIRAETGIGLSYTDRIGDNWHDITFTGFADASYAFNRTASLEARYTYERTDRNEFGGKYDSHEVELRLRLQR